MIITKVFKTICDAYYRKRFYSSERDLRFHPKDSTFEYKHISMGKRVFINRRAYFSAPNGHITIGDDVLVGADVFIAAGNHKYTTVGMPINKQGYPEENPQIVICDDVWIASKVIVLGEVTIHEGSIVGAGSMVLKDIPPYCLCVGNPNCVPVKYRYNDDELREHLLLRGRTAEEAEKVIELRRKMTEDFNIKCN